MENMELACFQLISNAGMAKSAFMEALALAEGKDFEGAEAKMKEGSDFLIAGHNSHAGLIQKEAAGEPTPVSLLLLHAEDQLMSAELIETMVTGQLRLLRRVAELESAS